MQQNSFDYGGNEKLNLPLATQMRPQSLENFFGQENVLDEIKKFKSNLPHLILWGPPGTGKTTLANLIAQEMKMRIYQFNAVMEGVPQLRKLIEQIKREKKDEGVSPLLFIDEIHRFNKAQQDALLPFLEGKEFLFVGATTEYPQSSLNRALISRVRILSFQQLSENHIENILTKAIQEIKREDLGRFCKEIAKWSEGDARYALNTFSLLTNLDENDLNDPVKLKSIIQKQRAFDKNQDRHYDVISAFIKSMRGSDPDAALLWLAVMLDGGEDPIFIARRLMIFASEDIGLANSQALQLAVNAHYVCQQIGMPEARITLAHATTFMALSPKSNSTYMGINKSLEFVRDNPTAEVPGYLKNNGLEKKQYKYPHGYNNHYVKQDYFATNFEKMKFYQAGKLGSEEAITSFYRNITQDGT
ncbi:replication-associated recombination protein A [Bacteriovoracaceae bacterium]|nr:replication-associated recombination protein A [Bacteriovoracaceae bacterium]